MGRWLVIHPEVFIFISTHNLLFYNAISCEYKTIKLNDGFTKLVIYDIIKSLNQRRRNII